MIEVESFSKLYGDLRAGQSLAFVLAGLNNDLGLTNRLLSTLVAANVGPNFAYYGTYSAETLGHNLDSDGSIARRYGTTGVPETFIVDKNGILQKKIVGGLNWVAPEVIAYLNELAVK